MSSIKLTADSDILPTNTARKGDIKMASLHPSLQKVERYYGSYSGFNYKDHFLRNTVAKKLNNMNELVITLSRNLKIKKLLNPGVCLELITHSEDYITSGETYFVIASDIQYVRDDSTKVFTCVCRIRCRRGNLVTKI